MVIARAVLTAALAFKLCASAAASESWSCAYLVPQSPEIQRKNSPRTSTIVKIAVDGTTMTVTTEDRLVISYQLLVNDRYRAIGAVWDQNVEQLQRGVS